MPDLRLDPSSQRPRLLVACGAPIGVDRVVDLVAPDGRTTPVPIVAATDGDGGWLLEGTAAGMRAAARWRTEDDIVVVDLDLAYDGDGVLDTGVRFALDLPGRAAEPDWMIPGCFYRHNRFPECVRRYPRAVAQGGDPALLESTWWSFRSDRAAVPAVFGWTDAACVGMATDPVSDLGLSGLGFGLRDRAARIWVDFPFREEPVVFDGSALAAPADVRWHRWRAGERRRLGVRIRAAAPDPHAYDPFVRHLYDRDRPRHEPAPWLSPEDAAALTAFGLHRWHWHPEHDALYETAVFDRTLDALDRPHMHVGWVSGAPWAHALLVYGRRSGNAGYVEAAGRVLDKITGERTPAGTLWGMWTLARGWRGGWNPDPSWVHARTLAEATLFLVRAARVERAASRLRRGWEQAIAENLAFAVEAQDDAGNLGSYYDLNTGQVTERGSAAGMLWIAALVEGSALLGDERLLAAARRAGRHYGRYVEDAFIYGAPEDVHLAPTSEDAYNALIAYTALHRADGDAAWLALARQAADWMMTFRWTYNIAFDDRTLLGRYGFRSRGADQASPSNQHLHAYGLICLEELVHLWRRTGDAYYLHRARDNLDCFLQLIAREDGDFNARKGMVSERYYQTNCFQPKGSLLTLSHAWCVGVTLHGCLVAMDDPEAFPPAATDKDPVHG